MSLLPGTTDFGLFVAACLLMNLTPGPDMLYVATRSVEQGTWAGVASALGITTGCMIYVVLSALGLAGLFIYYGGLFEAVKWLGIAYLAWLGIRSIHGARCLEIDANITRSALSRVYGQGVVVNLLNPKIALFLLAFLPQFVDAEATSITLPIIALGVVFNITGTTVNSLVAVAAGKLSVRMIARRSPGKWPSVVSGVILLLLACGLVFI